MLTSMESFIGLRLTFGEEANYGFIISAAHPSGRNKSKCLLQFTSSGQRHLNQVRHDFDSEKTLMLSNNVQQMKGRTEDHSLPCTVSEIR